jgi:hypothetical protein
MTYPVIKYSETYYKNIDANTEDLSPGVTPANGEQLCIYRLILNGADPSAYVAIIWDRGGNAEKVFISSRGDVDLTFDSSCHDLHFTGDGSKKLQIVIINDNDSATPIIGGRFEVVGVD